MKAVLKELDTNGPISFDLFCPKESDLFGLWITLHIGPSDAEGAHLYQLLICTPDWLKQKSNESGAVWGRHMLIVPKFNKDRIRSEIERYIESCEGSDFWEIAQQIARVAAWEFEDYRS